MKEQDKTAGKKILHKTERSNLPDKGLKVLVIKMFIKLGRKISEHKENWNKEMQNL